MFFVPEPEERPPSGWFLELRNAVSNRLAQDVSKASFIIPGTDPMNAHYPRYATLLRHRGGPEAFFQERQERVDCIWRLSRKFLPLISPKQRILLFDLESSHVPSSASIHKRKRELRLDDEAGKLVHVCIASSTAHGYRPGVDVSFPGVIPGSLGDDEAARRRPSERRPLLMSFKGVNSHPMRDAIYKLHNGTDCVCIDATQERQPEQLWRKLASGGASGDQEYPDLSSASKFVVCPTGDDVYSFRFVEALSCGAVPVIFGDTWVLPFSELPDIDYSKFAVLLAEADASSTERTLRSISDAKLQSLQTEGSRVYLKHFKTVAGQIDAIVEIVRIHISSDGGAEACRYQTPDAGTILTAPSAAALRTLQQGRRVETAEREEDESARQARRRSVAHLRTAAKTLPRGSFRTRCKYHV